ncbi:putative MOB kinase activator family [Helianthus annuus]|nr:putative MOB kinase activator family [Helianthus annuus]
MKLVCFLKQEPKDISSKEKYTFGGCGFLQSSESSLCTLTEFCTPEICPTMTAGPKYDYRWLMVCKSRNQLKLWLHSTLSF